MDVNFFNKITKFKILEDTLVLSTGNLIVSFSAFYFWSLVSKFYPDAILGNGVIIISYLSMGVLISVSGINQLFIIKTRENFAEIPLYFVLSVFVSVLIMLIEFFFFLIIIVINNQFFLDYFTLLLTFIYGLVWILLVQVSGIFVSIKKMKMLLLRDIIFALSKFLFLFLFINLDFTLMILNCWGFSLIITLITLYFFGSIKNYFQLSGFTNINFITVLRHISISDFFSFIYENFKFISFNWFGIIFTNVPQFIYPIILFSLTKNSLDVFIYYISWKLITVFYMFSNNVGLSFLTRNKSNNKNLKLFLKRLFYFILLLGIIIVISELIIYYALLFFFTPKLSMLIAFYFRIFLLGVIPFILNQLISLYELSFNNAFLYFFVNVVIVIFPLVSIFLLKNLFDVTLTLIISWVVSNYLTLVFVTFKILTELKR